MSFGTHCDVCREPFPPNYNSSLRVILPAGLTEEVMDEAIDRAVEYEEDHPTNPDSHEGQRLRILATTRNLSTPEEFKLEVGRALKELGAFPVETHRGECAERAPTAHAPKGAPWLGGKVWALDKQS